MKSNSSLSRQQTNMPIGLGDRSPRPQITEVPRDGERRDGSPDGAGKVGSQKAIHVAHAKATSKRDTTNNQSEYM